MEEERFRVLMKRDTELGQRETQSLGPSRIRSFEEVHVRDESLGKETEVLDQKDRVGLK